MLSFEMRESGYFYEVDSSYSWQDWIDSGDPGSEDFQIRLGTVIWLVWSEELFYLDGSEVLPEDLIADYVNDTGSSGGGGSNPDPDPDPPASDGHNCYIGINGKARKFTDVYIGVNGKARKVKKIYIGVNGKARLCWISTSSGGGSTQTFIFEVEGYEYFAPIDITWGDWIEQGHPGSEDFHWNRGYLYHTPSGVLLDGVMETDLIINTV